jgi:hypothetical protein
LALADGTARNPSTVLATTENRRPMAHLRHVEAMDDGSDGETRSGTGEARISRLAFAP